jgi:hypothetical protein
MLQKADNAVKLAKVQEKQIAELEKSIAPME